VPVAVTPLAVPVTVTVTAVWTGVVARLNVAVVAPAGTTTEAGGVPAALLDERATVNPPTGAGLEMVTVPVDAVPPVTDPGLKARPVSFGAVTVRVATWLVVAKEAVMFDVESVATATVVTVKVAVDAPAGTVTEPGTVATAVFDETRFTEYPPVGALPVRVTVPVEVKPPPTEAGLRVTL